MAVATRSHTPVITKDELQRVLPEHLKVTGVEEGTVIGFLEQDARDDSSWSRPITPDTDQAAVKYLCILMLVTIRVSTRVMSPAVFIQICIVLYQLMFVFMRITIFTTLTVMTPEMAIEHLEVGSRGAVDYTVVLC